MTFGFSDGSRNCRELLSVSWEILFCTGTTESIEWLNLAPRPSIDDCSEIHILRWGLYDRLYSSHQILCPKYRITSSPSATSPCNLGSLADLPILVFRDCASLVPLLLDVLVLIRDKRLRLLAFLRSRSSLRSPPPIREDPRCCFQRIIDDTNRLRTRLPFFLNFLVRFLMSAPKYSTLLDMPNPSSLHIPKIRESKNWFVATQPQPVFPFPMTSTWLLAS